MLVCAPSNGAVDELTNRLALESGGVWDHRGKAFAPRIVRLGKPSEEAPGRVKGVSLEVMVEERSAFVFFSTPVRRPTQHTSQRCQPLARFSPSRSGRTRAEEADVGLGGVSDKPNKVLFFRGRLLNASSSRNRARPAFWLVDSGQKRTGGVTVMEMISTVTLGSTEKHARREHHAPSGPLALISITKLPTDYLFCLSEVHFSFFQKRIANPSQRGTFDLSLEISNA